MTCLIQSSCGVTEIRTREPLVTVTRFPGVPLQPLEHHSCPKKVMQNYNLLANSPNSQHNYFFNFTLKEIFRVN